MELTQIKMRIESGRVVRNRKDVVPSDQVDSVIQIMKAGVPAGSVVTVTRKPYRLR